MNYLLKGRLCGYICADCPEPLSFVKVRLYRVRPQQNAVALAAAAPKDTLAILDDAQMAAKQSQLLAEVETDADGNFSVELGEQHQYSGEAVEVDVYCATVPYRKPTPTPPAPRQFTITVLQPKWRQTEQSLVAAWEYCLPHRFWCALRGLFGAWTICGRVTVCDNQQPVGGVKVRAFDVDWLQDDALGFGITDATGRFRIDYTTADFTPTIFSPAINLELTGGPDLYFKVETLAGTILLAEPRSRGRDPDRENAGPCFCVKLCLKEQPPINEPLPVFTAIGGYQYVTDIHSTPPGSGLTQGDNRAFFSTLRLNGILPKKLNGNSMEYRFEVRNTDATGTPTSGWTAIAPGQIARTVLGLWQIYAPAFPGDPNPIKTKLYTVNGTAGPSELVTTISADGWIQVPQQSNVFGVEGFFQPNGNMINLISPSLAAFGAINLAGVTAGNSSTSNGAALAQDRHYSIRMRVREQGSAVPGVDAGVCEHVAIMNTLYDNISHHPSWAGYTQSGALGVAMLDIAQLQASGCSHITNNLDVLFTATHPNLGAVNIDMAGPGGPYSFTLPAAVAGERFGTATPNFNVAALPACAYLVTLSVELLLTTGDSAPSPLYDQIAFCK